VRQAPCIRIVDGGAGDGAGPGASGLDFETWDSAAQAPKERIPGLHCPLLFDVAMPVDTAALKKAVMNHALAKEKKGDCQGDKKHELSNSEPERPFSYWSCLIRVGCHVSHLIAKSGDCHGIAIELLTVMPEIA
jgi:hypothetical protein